ncbi:MAG: tRNA guanosine(34) transglycosylase Tgt [Desulfobacteraceae bacterium 4572_35.2]|nr:MAG: tRNA guanosine(34) transglycosylase Tgt [Desulfobacteraceae bacterium 4572_35.2]
MFKFDLLHTDKNTQARRGRIHTPHGTIETPIFMPVGTHGALKALTPAQVEETGAQIILSNTYHLHLKPGEALVKKAGGLHKFMNWDKPILTDSGGFQVFSLPKKKITETGVFFRHEQNGDEIFTHDYSKKSVQKTLRWAESCLEHHNRQDQALFAIVQGSIYEDLRRECAEQLTAMDFPGYAIGGVSVGEGLELLKKVVDYTAPFLPVDKPRYLMGVGLPEDILESIDRGMDMFDCVIPTRYARSATLFTSRGKLRLTNRNYRRDFYPVDPACDCYCCRNFSRAYLHHLFNANEILSATLAAIHNVHFYLNMVAGARKAIEQDQYADYKQNFLEEYGFFNNKR